MSKQEQWYGSIIFMVGAFLLFMNLGTMTVDIMEARNFVTVREILQNGDWMHPTMNGILRLEKPPLPTWITAIFASVFGLKSLFFLRLPAALMALWMLFSLHALVKRLTEDKLLAMLSAIVLSGMLYSILLGRRGTWDIFTHSFMLAAIVQFVAMLQSVKPLRRGVWGGILWGAAFLSKGPVAAYAVFLPFLFTYLWYYRPLFGKEKRVALCLYVLMAIFISSSWFVFMYLSLGDDMQQIIGKEVGNWKSYNVRPWYYYVKDYPVHAGLWASVLAMSLFTKYTFDKSRDKKAFGFFWVWTVSSLVLLSLVPEKKVRYLFPTFLPAAFLVANYFYYLIQDFDTKRKKIDSILFKVHWGLFGLVALLLPVAVYLLFYGKKEMSWTTLIGVSATTSFCLLLLVHALKKGKRHFLVVAAVGLLASVVVFVLPHTDSVANKQFHSIEAVKQIDELQDLPCYALEETRIELVWLVGRKIKQLQTLEDLSPPYLILTNKPPAHYSEIQNYEEIGHYDNNSKAKGHKHYEQSLSKYVSVIR